MPCTGPVQQEVLAQILRQRTASEYRKTHRGRSPCGPSAQAREPRRGLIKIKKAPAPARGADQTAPTGQCPKTRRGPQGTIPLRYLLAPRCRAGAVCTATPIGPPAKPLFSHSAEKSRRGRSPAGLLGACGARCLARMKKAPSASATPCLRLALQYSAKAGFNCRVRDGTVIPASVVALAGAPRGFYEACQEPLSGATPGGPHGGHGRRSRIALGAFNRGCEELGLLVPLG